MHILIVDDNSANRALLRALFEPLGHRVILARQGREALGFLEAEGIDLIVSDILMPVMDGFQLCMEVKRTEQYCTIPFIFYTATYTDQEDETFALSLGANAFLRKPMDPEEFLAAIMEVIDRVDGKQILPVQPPQEATASLMEYSHLLTKKLDAKIAELEEEILAKKKTEKNLKKINRYLESIIENANVWFNVLDAKAQVVLWNKAAEQISGYSLEEVKGHGRIWEWLYPDPAYRKKVYEAASKIIQHGLAVEDYETSITCKNGKERTISWYSRNLTDEKNRTIGSIALGRDVSRRNTAEQEVQTLAKRYRQLFDANPDALFVLDNNGQFLDVNISAERRYQYSRQELLTMSAKDIAADDLQDETGNRVASAMREGTTFEWRHRRRDGTELPVEILPSVFEMDHGKKAILAVVRDLSDHKRQEQEYKLLQTQLHHAQRLESVGRLAGGVAHDYNNILSVILGYTEMVLQKVGPDAEVTADLREIYAAGIRSRDITRQLLAFARKEAIIPEVLDLNICVEGTLKILQRLIGEDIDLVWLPDKGDCSILMDPTQIDQLLANLCVNARDAIDDVGKIVIETRTVLLDHDYCEEHVEAKPGEYVVLSVSDNGCGMNRETVGNIFEPFFTTKEMGKGTGLGLATVHGIVNQNNGFINVYSEPGKGTTFRIYLPFNPEKDTAPRLSQVEKLPLGKGQTILVVEDEPAIMKLTDRMLTGLGYRVVTASTPTDALRQAGKIDDISLLLADVILPEMNGRELSEKIKECSPHTKTLFMSGYTADIIANRGIIGKGYRYIQKPFTTSDLAIKVNAALTEK